MGERYKGWLINKDSNQILADYKLLGLDDSQQEIFEKIYNLFHLDENVSRRAKLITKLSKMIRLSPRNIRNATTSLDNLTYSFGSDSGTDPQIWEESQHYRGESHPQSTHQ